MASGVTCLGSFGPKVPVSVRKEAECLANQIKTNKLIIFSGPVIDRVPGIEGNMPNAK